MEVESLSMGSFLVLASFPHTRVLSIVHSVAYMGILLYGHASLFILPLLMAIWAVFSLGLQ